MKIIAWILVLGTVGTIIWFALGIWMGVYSVYSYPPSRQYPDGVTMIVSREKREPAFNSPQHKPAPEKPAEKKGGMSFEPVAKPTRPLEERIIIKLPYVDWAYQKSLTKASQK